jgi:hypothetical protein
MKYRNVVLQDNITVTPAGTTTYDINLADVISRLQFKFNITNGAAAPALIAHPARAITRIEVIDGSHTIASLSGEELLVQNYYDNGRTPYSYLNAVTNTDSIISMNLDFGRWLWDNELALDPKRYMNPQIRVTQNRLAYATDAAAAFMTITADVFDEKSVSPKGFLKRHEITTWTPANNTINYAALPTDFPIRALFACGYATTTNYSAQIRNIKLIEDQAKKIPLDTLVRHYLGNLIADYQPVTEQVIIVGSDTVYTMASWDVHWLGLNTAAADLSLTSQTADTLIMVNANAAARSEGIAHGYIPFHTIPVYFGDKEDLSDWYDTSNIKNLELQTLGSAAVGAAPVGRIHLEQLVPF